MPLLDSEDDTPTRDNVGVMDEDAIRLTSQELPCFLLIMYIQFLLSVFFSFVG